MGGVGFRNVHLWNTAAAGNLWVKWIHAIYIKGADW